MIDRVHPARGELPTLWGDAARFAQATWRHLLFGVVLGELERRLNPPEREARPIDDAGVDATGTAASSTGRHRARRLSRRV